MTNTTTAAVSATVNLLSRPYGNLTDGEKLDAAKMIAALSAQLEAANQGTKMLAAALCKATGQMTADQVAEYVEPTLDSVSAKARDDALVEAAAWAKSMLAGLPMDEAATAQMDALSAALAPFKEVKPWTPARKAALQWFHDRGEVGWLKLSENPPSDAMMRRMIADGQLQMKSQGNWKPILHSLTDAGRRALHGDRT